MCTYIEPMLLEEALALELQGQPGGRRRSLKLLCVVAIVCSKQMQCIDSV